MALTTVRIVVKNITNNLRLYSCRVTQEARLCAGIPVPGRRSGSCSGSHRGEMIAVMLGSPGSIPGYSDTSTGSKIFWTRISTPPPNKTVIRLFPLGFGKEHRNSEIAAAIMVDANNRWLELLQLRRNVKNIYCMK